MKLSAIVPTLNEEGDIVEVLASISSGLMPADELIVVDGGSSDATVPLARERGARVLVSPRGRALQLNAGAAASSGDILVFVHADTRLPGNFRANILGAVQSAQAAWGRFDVRFDGGGPLLSLIAILISRRSRLFRSATGDQAIFVRRDVFTALGGYAQIALFEDVELCRRLRRAGAMAVPEGHVVTSARRWRNRGAWRTVALMWGLKAAYLSGVPAGRLAPFYRDER